MNHCFRNQKRSQPWGIKSVHNRGGMNIISRKEFKETPLNPKQHTLFVPKLPSDQQFLQVPGGRTRRELLQKSTH
jgi:hypothetical protein